MQLLILGSGGQLGRELARAVWPSGVDVRALSHAELDITDEAAVQRVLRHAGLVINAAAYTAVDRAETEPERAFSVNRDGPQHLARACKLARALLVHVSTDYVFDGSKNGAYVEEDAVAPLGVYGLSKAAGELAIRTVSQEHIIVRTSWVVSAFGQNFVKTMLRLAAERDSLRVVADQFGRPTPAKALAGVLVRIAQRHAEGSPIPWGTYHFAASGRATWYDLARQVVDLQASHTGRRPDVEPITTDQYPTPARRPRNSELDTQKIQTALMFVPNAWQDGVAEVVGELLGERCLTG